MSTPEGTTTARPDGYPPTPELDKAISLKTSSEQASAFYDHLRAEGIVLARWLPRGDDARLVLDYSTPADLIASWLGIDQSAMEAERMAVLEWLRERQ